MWIYHQESGRMFHNTTLFASGYSGHDQGVNQPEAENIPRVGPVPCGHYTIQPAITHPEAGPITMHLTPASDNVMFGRSGMMLHGDNLAMNHSASEGCIILSHAARAQIAVAVAGGDDLLQVVP